MVVLLLRILMGASVLGAGATCLALLLGAAGRNVLPLWLAVLLVGSGAATLVGMLIVQLTARQKVPGRDLRTVFLDGCPPWVRRPCIGLSLAGFVLGVGLGFSGYEPPDGGLSSLLTGAFCLFLFPASFVSFYSYSRQLPELDRRCPRGHEVPFGARFCPECGEDV